ncbi:N-acetylglucosamine-6-phosphate deacetylase [Sporosarcina sp. BI001-red]|uniref:N-acetylglucosamine-6-phosphate deacetylase n=1 Tax=Sporosarcina sp. BI001-red TaxID=2282866 RepID=UPI000E26A551|nr:N-acetylglucosamine-6-phosphate deacetylase [Sporosarcina sp. BI001-red]REB10109.1 N-acetylglucosamine-6-phosphate deacetylase [Sporosarcina sp. BI001-red]
MKNIFLLNAPIVLEDSFLQNGYIQITGEKIEAFGDMLHTPLITKNDQVIDCRNCQYVIPGMIDIHVHGAAGFDFMDGSPEAYEKIAYALAKEGTTAFLATTITNPIKHTEDTISKLEKYHQLKNKPGTAEMLGIHLEGPFINAIQKGAQPENAIIVPNVATFKEWQELSGNMIKIITFAPELDEDYKLLKELKNTNVIPSMGHTNASYDESLSAINEGVQHATHLFNGMKGMHHRDPGVVGAVLLKDEIHVEIIPDGIHFHKDLLKMIVRMKGIENVLVITDGMRAKGMPDGEYDLGGQQVTVRDGKCVLSNSGSLAGSIVTMNEARLNLEKWLQLTIHEQIQMTSINQAKRLNLYHRKGSIQIGKDADLVVIGRDGEVEFTICRGIVAYNRNY